MSALTCSRCGAPLTRTSHDDATVTCRFCATQDAAPVDRDARVVAVVEGAMRDQAERDRRLRRGILIGVAVIAGVAGFAVLTLRSSPPAARPLPSAAAVSVVAATAPVLPPTPTLPTAVADPSAVAATVTLTLSGAFTQPRNVAVDADGFAYVSDHTGRIQRFNPEGTLVSTLRAETTNAPHGPLSTDIDLILGLAVDRKGTVFASIGYDLARYEVASGKLLGKTPHAYPATCFRDVTVDQTGALFVRSACTDSNRYGIVKMDRTGKTIATFSEGPAWERDSSDRIAVDASGNLYVSHKYENLVYVLDAHGKTLSHFGGRGDQPGYFHAAAPGPIAIDPKGRVFVVNWGDLDVFDLEGHARGRIPPKWKGLVRDLAIGPDGQLWLIHDDGALRMRIAD